MTKAAHPTPPSAPPRFTLTPRQKRTLRDWRRARPHWSVRTVTNPDFDAEEIVIDVPEILTEGFGMGVRNWCVYPAVALEVESPRDSVAVSFWEDQVAVYDSLSAALRDVAVLWCRRDEGSRGDGECPAEG